MHNIQPITTPQQLAQVPLSVKQGKVLNLGDVADVTWGYPPLIGDAVINGGPGLMLVVEKFPGANTLDVTNGIDKALSAMAPSMPGVHDQQPDLPPGQLHPDRHPQPVAVGAARLHPRGVRAADVPLPVARGAGLPAGHPAVAGGGGDRARRAGHDDQHDDPGRVRRRGRRGRRRRDHRHGEHRAAAARLAGRRADDQPVPRRARRVARGAGRDLLRDADQHHRRHPRHARRRPHRRVLRAAGPGLRPGGARLDGGGADGDAGPRLHPAARRQAQGGRAAGGPGRQAGVLAGAVGCTARPRVRVRRGRHRGARRRLRLPAPRRGPVPVVQGAGLPHALRDQAGHVGHRAGPDGRFAAGPGAEGARRQHRGQPRRPGPARRGSLRRQLL